MIGLANDFSHIGSALPATMSTPASIAAELQLLFDTLYLTQVSKYAQGRRESCLAVFYSTLVASAFCFLLYDIVLKADEEVGSFRHDAYQTRYDTHGSRIH